MSGQTPGQAAYEARDRLYNGHWAPWAVAGKVDRDIWEQIAQAAINAQQPQPAPELKAAMAETRRYRDRLAVIRDLCEKRIKIVGVVDGKGVAKKIIAIIDKPEA